MYIIWNKQILGLYRLSEGWRAYPCSDVTSCHQNHVHFSLTWAGAMGRTSYWSKTVAAMDYGPCRVANLAWSPSYSGHARVIPCPNVASPAWPAASPADPPFLRLLRLWSGASLRQGSTGPGVTAVQQALQLGADGVFGASTTSAVSAWQTAHNIAATGWLAPPSWLALLTAVTPASTVKPPPVVTPTPTPTPVVTPTPTPTPTPTTPPTSSTATDPIVVTPVPAPVLPSVPVVPPVPASSWKAPVLTTVPSKAGQSLLAFRSVQLRTGSNGAAVRALQLALRTMGHTELTGTGTFGPNTKAAVIAFQRTQHVPATGVVDATLWSRLIVAVTLYPYRNSALMVGSTGAPVRALQWVLRAPTTGTFGSLTKAALISYQRAHHMAATGTTVRATWASLSA
jgi:peptidoglycan hydrolase-like protein with peptidoglycan-binding domain